MNKIHGIAGATVIGPGYSEHVGDPATGKPYIVIVFHEDDGTIVSVNVTANLLDMLGGVGKGVLGRIKDLGL